MSGKRLNNQTFQLKHKTTQNEKEHYYLCGTIEKKIIRQHQW